MRSILLVPALILTLTLGATTAPQVYRLPNGLRLILAENHERPIVRLELRTALEPADMPRGKEGLEGYLFDVLSAAGAGDHSRAAFRDFLDSRALRFRRARYASSLAWSVVSDSQGQDAAFEALALAVARPRLDASQVELWRQQFIRSTKEQSSRQQAEDAFLRAIRDPGRVAMPSAVSIHRIENADLDVMLRHVVRPERSVLVVQGDLNLGQAKQLALLHLGAWGPRATPPVAPAEDKTPSVLRETRTWIVREAGVAPEILAGGCTPAQEATSTALRSVVDRLVRLEMGGMLPEGLLSADVEIKEGGSWLIRVKMREGRPATEGLQFVQDVCNRLENKQLTESAFAEARKRWQIERTARGLHPERDAEHLAELALRNASLEDPLDQLAAKDLEQLLRRMFDRRQLRYHVTGEIREDGGLFEKLGLAPVSVVD